MAREVRRNLLPMKRSECREEGILAKDIGWRGHAERVPLPPQKRDKRDRGLGRRGPLCLRRIAPQSAWTLTYENVYPYDQDPDSFHTIECVLPKATSSLLASRSRVMGFNMVEY